MTSPLDPISFLNGNNAVFVSELYARYLDSPNKVDPSWRAFFADMHDDVRAVLGDMRGPSWAPRSGQVIGMADLQAAGPAANGVGAPPPVSAVPMGVASADRVRQATLDSIRALMLIRAFRVRGHLEANLDPLGLNPPTAHPELDPRTYGFSEADMEREIYINYVLGIETARLKDILQILRETYCGSIGVEFMHSSEPDQKAWIQERVEAIRNHTDFTVKGKRAILERLIAAEAFEQFLDRKYTGTKRFGLEGGESLIPALEQILKRGGQLGLREVVLGMPHRGRLNVLANFMGKPFSAIFSEFQGNAANPEDVQGSGDVKYHLGTSADREFDGNVVHLSLTANPSHLEAVNPVVLGKVRAKQRQLGDTEREKVMGLLMHGDAAFAGQGLVPESLELSELKGYRTGGTVHCIVNNQIGFTTSPAHSRSSPYCSDVAKTIQAPILHVNGDDPEAVVHVARMAIEFRQKFKKDVVVDMFCYRRHGHNEGDEPAFTQPLMYKKIARHPTTRQIYGEKLVREGVLQPGEPEAMVRAFETKLEQAHEAATGFKPNKADWLEGKWSGLGAAHGEERRGDTSADLSLLREVGMKLTETPSGFHLNRKIVRQLEAKRRVIETGDGVDWATGEALAFGTLLCEGVPVRLSGQDCGRGTFSQRHAVLVDQENEEKFIPLNSLRYGQAPFEVLDSPLAEASVLGFEYGVSLAEPHMLVLWEAQFGDFANGAQVIIDQFISSGESKWLRMSGLVMLLPHGYEGQGPEHSSARLERYLQLCGEDNMQVVNVTTPANYFHLLRRQVRRDFRKPLIVMSPKSLLRHKLAQSKLADMGPGTTFHRVLWDDAPPKNDKKVRRVVLCSGKVYYDLFEERQKRGIDDVYLMRIEQLYPFPLTALGKELSRFKSADVVWCQEESKNMGAWTFVAPRIEEVLAQIHARQARPIYCGRPDSASPATGLHRRHVEQQAKLVADALTAGLSAAAARGKRQAAE
ncbi:MAG: 2-oxoglutarate dehydrogenase E1 component [Alphaproteobacteria bacterium]|nr:2-oxoglutarate dehydrogenase E1 component [Alphaproteobacteria bacterium]